MSSQNIESICDLVNDEKNSCIIKKHEKLQLLVLPAYFNNISKGIRVALDSLTVGYSTSLGGLVLGFENIKVVEGSGWLHSTNPYIHVHIQGTFYLFSPTVGLHIKGTVNELSGKKVSFLAYGKYNVAYRANEVSAHLAGPEHKAARDYLMGISSRLKEGDVCTLQLVDVTFRDFMPHLLCYPVRDTSDADQSAWETESTTSSTSAKRVTFSDLSDCNSDDASCDVPSTMAPPHDDDDSSSNSGVDGSIATPTPPPLPPPVKAIQKKLLTNVPTISGAMETFSPALNGITNQSYLMGDPGKRPQLSSKELKKLIKQGMLRSTDMAPMQSPSLSATGEVAGEEKSLKKKKSKKLRDSPIKEEILTDSETPPKLNKRKREEIEDGEIVKNKKRKKKLSHES